MRPAADRLVFGRIVGDRVVGRRGTGAPAVFPLGRRERLLVSRADCDLVFFRVPAASVPRARKRISAELPRSYPGRLADYASDCLLQRHRHGWVAVVALMKREALALYEDAAGSAPLTLLPFLLMRVRRFPAVARIAGFRTHRAAPRALEGQVVFTDGSTTELATFSNGTLTSSVLLVDPCRADAPTGSSSPLPVLLPTFEDGTLGSASSLPLPRHRLPSSHRLFDEERGVRRWTRSPFLSSAFLALALPLLASASLAAGSLLSRRVEEVQEPAARAAREPFLSTAASGQAGTNVPHERLSRGTAFGPAEPTKPRRRDGSDRDAYSILCALRRAVAGNAAVRTLSVSHGTVTLEILAEDPLGVLRKIESAASVSEAELGSAGARAGDGRVPATLRVVYR